MSVANGAEYIGKECFRDSGLEKVTLPNTLLEIGEKAFEGCDKLRIVLVEEGGTLDIRKYVKDVVEVRQM